MGSLYGSADPKLVSIRLETLASMNQSYRLTPISLVSRRAHDGQFELKQEWSEGSEILDLWVA